MVTISSPLTRGQWRQCLAIVSARRDSGESEDKTRRHSLNYHESIIQLVIFGIIVVIGLYVASAMPLDSLLSRLGTIFATAGFVGIGALLVNFYPRGEDTEEIEKFKEREPRIFRLIIKFGVTFGGALIVIGIIVPSPINVLCLVAGIMIIAGSVVVIAVRFKIIRLGHLDGLVDKDNA